MTGPWLGRYSTLCFPDGDKSCFGCCPPIRPAGYDHLDHRAQVEALLEKNTRDLARTEPTENIIEGEACWGLGYLNPEHTLIGCLLHPAALGQTDRRDLTGYGPKCRRELCREAVLFAALSPQAARWVLQPADGLDSFHYSSQRANPVFTLLRWGPILAGSLMEYAPAGLFADRRHGLWDLLFRRLRPGLDRFSLETLTTRLDWAEILRPGFIDNYWILRENFIKTHRAVIPPPLDNRPFVHQLALPPGFVWFLRNGLGRPRARQSEASKIMGSFVRALESLTGGNIGGTVF